MGRLAVAVIVGTWVVPISILVNRIVPEPYMDEIFHVPQAQEYCKGNFKSWDPMITTPPGLYYISLAYVASLYPWMYLLDWSSSLSGTCSTAILRSLNGVLAVLCSILVYDIIIQLRPIIDRRKATLCAVILALYPLHWFFTYLYYTDVASLSLFLAMYLACMRKNYWFGATLGAFSVFIRQTNIIWMLFVACASVLDMTLGQRTEKVRLDNLDVPNGEKGVVTLVDHVGTSLQLKNRKVKKTESTGYPYVPRKASRIVDVGFVDELQTLIIRSWLIRWQLFFLFIPFLVVLVGFIIFVHWNGSIVLGAKEAHAVSLHFTQMLYFGLASALASASLHFTFSRAAVIYRALWKGRPLSIFLAVIALIAGFVSVHFFSIAHPYLLADNRHYPFYLWRKVINAHWSSKYLLVPLYIHSWISIFNILGEFQKKVWLLAYYLACAAVLVPAPLIEFRYYTIPLFILMLHFPMNDSRQWVLMGLAFILVNIFTMSMFLYQPFRWDHEPGVQRFIW